MQSLVYVPPCVLTGSAGDLLDLPRAMCLLSPDAALLCTSHCGAALDFAPAAHQGHGADEPKSRDPHGSAGVGQGHSIIPAGAWGCQSAPNRESILRHGHAARSVSSCGVHVDW